MLVMISFVYLLPSSKEQKDRIYNFLAFSLLFILMALRSDSVGADSSNYAQIFISIGKSNDWNAAFQVLDSAPVYVVLCRLGYMIMPAQQTYFILNAAIICICMSRFFRTFSNNLVLSVYCFVMLWFYATAFNIMRQYIAMSIVMLAFCLAKEKKKVAPVGLLLLAIGIHNTAAVCFPFLWLFMYDFHLTRKGLVWITSISLVGGVLLNILFDPLIRLFSYIFPRYGMYINGLASHSVYDQNRGDNIYLTIFYLGIIFLSVLVIWKQTKNGKSVSGEVSKMFIFSLIGVVLGLAMARNEALSRVRTYFTIFMCCLIPQTVRNSGNARARVLYYFALYLVLLFPYAICLSRNLSGVVPYQFFWEV